MKFIVATLALLVIVFMSGSIFVVAGAINNKSFLEYWVGYLSPPALEPHRDAREPTDWP